MISKFVIVACGMFLINKAVLQLLEIVLRSVYYGMIGRV